MSQALYLKWRPQTWDSVVGQEHIVQTLRNALAAERVSHAYLFAGPRGTGKTSVARLLAKAVNCLEKDVSQRPCGRCNHCQAVNEGRFLDLIEIDAASNTSVEDVRDLRDKINFSPNQGRYKVYIIDEVHMLSTAAFNALLKTLEEPPSHAIFILATTEVHKIPATVLSRCQRHEFRRIPLNRIVDHLRSHARDENIGINEEALVLIARQSTGAMRDAISLLDQLASTGQNINLEMAQEVLGTAPNQAVVDVVEALIEAQRKSTSEAMKGLDSIHATLDAGSDPRQFGRQIVDYLRGLLLIQSGSPESIDATAELRAQMARHASQLATVDLLRILRLFNEAATESRAGWQPALPLELAFITALTPEPRAKQDGAEEYFRAEGYSRNPGGETQREKKPFQAEAAGGTTASGPAVQKGERASSPRESVSDQAGGGASGAIGSRTGAGAAAEGVADQGGDVNENLFHQINDQWRQVVNQVGLTSKQTQALLNSCRPYGVKAGVLFLGFNGDFAKAKMEKGDNIEITCRVLAQIMGKEVPVRCFIAAGGKGSLPPDVESDGMVATAMRDLGGEVVDIQ
jgi:DNA polymerase III subunit gamma/tau